MLTIFVPGDPAPQGSKRHVGNGVLVESCKRVKDWRETVRFLIEQELKRQGYRLEKGGALVILEFVIPRPKRMPKGRVFPETPPDIDKLQRAVNDAIHDSRKTRRQPVVRRGPLRDDSQICSSSQFKRYARAGEEPGCWIHIGALRDESEQRQQLDAMLALAKAA